MSAGFRQFMAHWRWDQLYDEKKRDNVAPYYYFQAGEGGIPAPGPDFMVAATSLAPGALAEKKVHELVYRAAYDDAFELPVRFKAAVRSMPFILGGTWNYPAQGPIKHHKVMVIGKHPGTDEVLARKNLVGPSGVELKTMLSELGVDWRDWYVTNVVRHNHLNPQGGNLEKNWIKDCYPLLIHEIRQVRPDYILLLGSEAVQTLLGNRGRKGGGVPFAQARTQVTDFEIPLPDGTVHVAKACACYHPAYILKSPEKRPELMGDLRRFATMLKGGSFETIDKNVYHLLVTKESQLTALVDFILTLPPEHRDTIAVDAEWHGDYPGEPGAYIRTVQFSWAPRCAAVVRLHEAGGEPGFEADVEVPASDKAVRCEWGMRAAVRQMKRLMKSTPDRHVRIGGHFLNADMPWLLSIGLDVRKEYEVAAWPDGEAQEGCPPAWDMTKHLGGFDTILAAHAVEETQDLKLEVLAQRYLGTHRYDKKLQAWKDDELKRRKLKDNQLEGYGECPNTTLEGEPFGSLTDFGQPVEDSYGGFDADVTRRLWDVFNGVGLSAGLLDADRFGQPSRQPFWRSMWACPAFGECHMAGIGVNTEAADVLANLYKRASTLLLEDLRKKIHWPTFNINSADDKVEFLHGEEYTRKKSKVDGSPIRTRPRGDNNDVPEATCLRLPPYKTTGKKPKLWEQVVQTRQQEYYSVSADKEVLAVLGDKNPLVAQLRDITKLAYLSKTVLRPEVTMTVKKKVKQKVPQKVPHSEEDAKLYKKKCPCKQGTVELETPCKCGFKTVEIDVPNPKLRRVHHFQNEDHGYEDGIFRFIQRDGRVRSQFFQTKETGRASSARPALMNWSKTLEQSYKAIFKRYRDIFGDLAYTVPMRSILQARPGYVLVDCDYAGAELAIAAWMSGDPTMIEHVRRNNLREDDPEYFDIHSSIAVRAFKLVVPDGVLSDEGTAKRLFGDGWETQFGRTFADILGAAVGQPLPFTKIALALAGKSHLRTAAKAVVFGSLYGQQAESLARKIVEQGIEATVEDAQTIMDTINETYPGLPAYFAAAASRPAHEGFLVTCLGRRRRFMPTTDSAVMSAQAREAMNFPMQGSVADGMQTAMGHVYRYRRENGMEDAYTINLTVHDAIVLEVKVEYLDRVVKEVLPMCMSKRVTVWPTDHSGRRIPGGPYQLVAPPADVFVRWSVPLTKDECRELKISTDYGIGA